MLELRKTTSLSDKIAERVKLFFELLTFLSQNNFSKAATVSQKAKALLKLPDGEFCLLGVLSMLKEAAAAIEQAAVAEQAKQHVLAEEKRAFVEMSLDFIVWHFEQVLPEGGVT